MAETGIACLRRKGGELRVGGMKWKLFVCGMVLLTAGCTCSNGPYATMAEFGYVYDYAARPIPGRTPTAMGADYLAPLGPVATGAQITMHPAPYSINVTASP
jgi:hypothetical protein